MFELFQLRCFVTVAEELHFGRAAARLFMTQPPLSRQIQLLEHALSVKLLERTSRTVRLTAAGKVFYADAVSILRHVDQAAVLAGRIEKGEAGRVTIGFTAVAGYELIPKLVSAVQEDLPNIDVVLKEMVSKDQMEALASGSIDIGLARPLHFDGVLQQVPLVREPLMLALPHRHRLVKRRQIAAADLHQEAMIMYSPGDGKYFFDLVTSMFAGSDVHPRYVQQLGQTHTILALVRGGLGVAIVPASAMSFSFPDIVFKPIWRKDVHAQIHLVWQAGHHNPAVTTVADFVARNAGRLTGRAAGSPRDANSPLS
jgi:DNA-binding transcriptional LysR family regulator